ncbi:MerR family transcriptional regulator [Bacillus sp. Soil745]|uniref:MerR family transcriptional regulator n=1 Tax=Peribacillus frigoritolerans TaxID=450367 RepID=UPI00070D2458|nr:MerR family transcriptional regulator [Peribacillus frigoritolerans]KRF59912.1 MerR family transcriptional regulator [Bacillus sp. Soil745]PAW31112.1 MerR family transcriptional regulator [Peribacillus simplex]MED3709211.1 MerR family transcriptional regulator [Peribacillus frigoritolerans]MED3888896.1 MerR family transcriptional regulator [Peribacillus frigoritolerans]ULM98021.1 MerR family transcriptional regulator [Peribacillus frigoritolerans]
MKIGTFAKLFHVTTDTVRYYIELGLLIPDKKNTQYQMNQLCLDDMAFIAELKKFHFPLLEIQQILSYRRVTNFSDHDDINYYNNLLIDKKNHLIKKKEDISKTIKLIEKAVQTSSPSSKEENFTGVPLSFVNLLYCPMCHIPLEMKDVTIKKVYIQTGSLTCTCGYEAAIEEGIIITANLYETSPYPSYFYDKETIKEINPKMINLFEKSNFWFQKVLQNVDLKNKLIVETNVDAFVSLPKYIDVLETSASYVFSGYSLAMLKKVRKRMERMDPKPNVLYILNSDLNLPLKPLSIDVFVDSFTANDFSLLNPQFPIHVLKNYFHSSSTIVGGYSYYDSSGKSLKNISALYPNSHEHILYPKYLEENLSGNGFQITQSENIGYCTDPGPFFDYHVIDEKFHMLMYLASMKK